jgi:hypothetical protein
MTGVWLDRVLYAATAPGQAHAGERRAEQCQRGRLRNSCRGCDDLIAGPRLVLGRRAVEGFRHYGGALKTGSERRGVAPVMHAGEQPLLEQQVTVVGAAVVEKEVGGRRRRRCS